MTNEVSNPERSESDNEDVVDEQTPPEEAEGGAEPTEEVEPVDEAIEEATSEEAQTEASAEETPEAEEPVAEESTEPEAQDESDESPETGDAESDEEAVGVGAEPEEENKKHWYCVKVQSGREDSIKRALERRTKIEGLEEFVGQIIVPEERIPEIRKGKRVERRHKLYPGYLMVEVEYNDRVLYLFRETTGVGDFVSGSVNRAPTPMTDEEVKRMLNRHQGGTTTEEGERPTARPSSRPPFSQGDRVRIQDGTFTGMEAEVKDILEERSLVKLEVTILGRTTEVDLEYWQVEQI